MTYEELEEKLEAMATVFEAKKEITPDIAAVLFVEDFLADDPRDLAVVDIVGNVVTLDFGKYNAPAKDYIDKAFADKKITFTIGVE